MVGWTERSPLVEGPPLPVDSENLPPLPLPQPQIPVGGRLAHFALNWQNITNDHWVLSLIKNGYQIPVHDFLSKTLLSNTTVSRIRHLVEKNDQKRHLVDFYYERSTTLGRKKSTKCRTFRLTRLDTLLECVSRIA